MYFTTRFIPLGIFFGLWYPSPTVPRRRVSIRPKPPRFRESKLPVHQAAISDLVTCAFDLQKNVYQKLIKIQLEMNLCCFQTVSFPWFRINKIFSAVSSQLTRWKRRSKAASFSMCLVYLERFPVLVCRGNDRPTVPPTNKMADVLYAYKIKLKRIYNHYKTSNPSFFDQTLM